jgi:hypothetical protein
MNIKSFTFIVYYIMKAGSYPERYRFGKRGKKGEPAARRT